MDRVRDILRSGDWLTRERVRCHRRGAASGLGGELPVPCRHRALA